MTDVKIPGIGPLDKRVVYGIAGVAGAFVVWRYLRGGSSSTAPDVAAEDAGAQLDEDVIGSGDYAVGTYSPNNVTGNVNAPAAEDGPPTTDAAWVQECVTDLAEIGYDPQAVLSALGKYLDRQRLTTAEVAIVVAARAYNGMPPQAGALPILTAIGGKPTPPKPPTPPAKPKPKPPARPKPGAPKTPSKPSTPPAKVGTPASAHFVTVRSGDTLTEIAQNNRTSLGKLKRFRENASLFNAAHRGGNLIHPGERVRVA